MMKIKKWNHMLLLSMIALVATTTGKSKVLRVNWGALTLVSLVVFLLGWYFLGLLAAVVIAIIVMILMGIITYK